MRVLILCLFIINNCSYGLSHNKGTTVNGKNDIKPNQLEKSELYFSDILLNDHHDGSGSRADDDDDDLDSNASGKGIDDEDSKDIVDMGSGTGPSPTTDIDDDDLDLGSGEEAYEPSTQKPTKKPDVTKRPENEKGKLPHPPIEENILVVPEIVSPAVLIPETATRPNYITPSSTTVKSHPKPPPYDDDDDEDDDSEDDDNKLNNEVSIMGQKQVTPASFFARPGILAAVIGGAVVGLLCAILLVMFIVYRMRKKDEGSYTLDEPKRSPSANPYARGAGKEFYA